MRPIRRAVFYLFYDEHGVVDDYISFKLRALRPFVEHIFVVSNSSLTPAGREKLNAVADTVYVRENIGFDVWAYREAMERFGRDRIAEYDEIILMNYTFFGPIFPFAETFERMDARTDVDFWGLTEHDDVPGLFPRHIQSHWIAVRKAMATSIEFQQYWDEMPPIESYDDSIQKHETRFTLHFRNKGFRSAVTHQVENYPSKNPSLDNIGMLLADRCPILKRRVFFHESVYLDRNAILGRRIMDQVAETGYPSDLIWQNVTRTAVPRILSTNTSLVSVLPDGQNTDGVPARVPRICAVVHVYYTDMIDEIVGSLRNIPVPFDLVVTTDTEDKRSEIESDLKRHGLDSFEVRVVESNDGRCESAFLVACRDVITSPSYDLVLKLHSKKSPTNPANNAELFKRHTLDNVLSSPEYVSNILQLFDKDPRLGMVFPPMVHIGFPTMGHAWYTNKTRAHEVAQTVGIETHFDSHAPLAPYGGMFWARPEALGKLAHHPFDYSDFAETDAEAGLGYQDGALTHVIERLYAYSVLDAGYFVRTVINADWASINYAFLEHKMNRITSFLPGYAQEQIDYLQNINGELHALRVERDEQNQHIAELQQELVAVRERASKREGPPMQVIKETIYEAYPRLAVYLRPGYRAARGAYRAAKRPPRP